MSANNWVGASVFGFAGLIALVIGAAILAARWPDVLTWWRATKTTTISTAQAREARLLDRIAFLAAENARLRADRLRYRQERNDARRMLDDGARNSVTVMQFPPT